MNVADEDAAVLDQACDSWSVHADSTGWTTIVLAGYRLPDGLAPSTIELLIHLAPQFPDIPPDMFWAIPDVRLASTGAYPPAADQRQSFLGRDWQRFSRHLAPGAWQVGVDDLGTWLAAIRRLLAQDAAA